MKGLNNQENTRALTLKIVSKENKITFCHEKSIKIRNAVKHENRTRLLKADSELVLILASIS